MKLLKYSLLIINLAFVFTQTFALSPIKSVTVSGKVIDALTKEALPGTIVIRDTINGIGVIAGADGIFSITGLKPNEVNKLYFEYIGYDNMEVEFTPMTAKFNLAKTVEMVSNSNLEEIIVYGSSPIAEIKGDTTQFNAGAYKINPDATVGDLLAKMPGFKQNDDGSVSKEGESIVKVLVDGRDFFRDNPSSALNSLPANIVKSIQYIDDKSDESKFSGHDDGTRIKTINIVTKANKKSAQMGEYYAGYGTENRYIGSANTNIFTEKSIISLGIGANNINNSPLTSDGYYGGENNLPGIQDAIGVKFNYDRTLEGGNVSATYMYDYGARDVFQETTQDYLVGDRSSQSQDTTYSLNQSHMLYLNYNQQINEKNRLVSRSNFTLTDNKNDDIRNSENIFANDGTLNTSAYTKSIKNSFNYNLRPNLMWFYKISEKSTIFTGFWGAFTNNNSTNILDSEVINSSYINENIEETYQKIRDISASSNIHAMASFTHKLSNYSSLSLKYTLNYDWSDIDKKTYIRNEHGQYVDIDEALSDTFARNYLNNTISLGYSFNKEEKHIFNAGVGYRNSALQNNMVFPAPEITENYRFHAPDFRMSYRLKISDSKNFNFFMRGSTNMPSITQLQDVLDVSDPLFVSNGNPRLKQSFNTFLMGYYRSANMNKSTSLSGYFRLQNIQNSFATHRQVITEDTMINGVLVSKGAELSTTVNLDGYWNFVLGGTYAIPIKAIKSNINADMRYNLRQTPSIYNGAEFNTLLNEVNFDISLVSNIRPEIDFTVGLGTLYSNSISNQASARASYAITQEVFVRADWIIWKGFFINLDYNYRYNHFSTSQVANPHQNILNASVGKKFLDNSLELRISAFDIFNQYKNISNTQNDIFSQDVLSNNLIQYVAFSITYKFNTLSGNSNLRSSVGGGPSRRYRKH